MALVFQSGEPSELGSPRGEINTLLGESTMSKFVVKLIIRSGVAEKISTSLVNADNEVSAGEIAIENEAHDTLDWGDGGAYDLGGDYFYCVYDVKPISTADYNVIKKYFY